MPIREATEKDLLPASKVLAQALGNDALHGAWLHPNHTEYTNDSQSFYLEILRVALSRWLDNVVFVAYETSTSERGEEETITAVAHWVQRYFRPVTDHDWALVETATTENQGETPLNRNRAAGPARIQSPPHLQRLMEQFLTGSRKEAWYLHLLGTDPSSRGKDYGRELVRQGFELAETCGDGCSIICSSEYEGYFCDCGFDVLAGKIDEGAGEDNLLKDLEPKSIMFWDNERKAKDTSGVADLVR